MPQVTPTLTQLFNAALQAQSVDEMKLLLSDVVTRLNAYDASGTDLYPDGDSGLLQYGRPKVREPKGNPIGGGLIGGIIAGM